MVKRKVVIGVFRHTESKSGLYFGPLFSPNTWLFLLVFCKTPCIWVNFGSQIFQNICPWLCSLHIEDEEWWRLLEAFLFYCCQPFTDLEREGSPQISKTCQTTEDCVLTCEIEANPTPHRLWKFANDNYDVLGYGRRLTIPAFDRPDDQEDEEIVCDAFTEGVNSELKLSQLIPLSVSRGLKTCLWGVRGFYFLLYWSDNMYFAVKQCFVHMKTWQNIAKNFMWD